MDRHPDVEVVSSERLLEARVFAVVSERVRLPSGLVQDLVLVDHPGAVCIAPVLPDGTLLMVRQYRHAAGDWLLELPAGRLEAGEDPLVAARRELEEETGFVAEDLAHLGSYYGSSGISDEYFHLFLATGLRATGTMRREATEQMELEFIPLADAVARAYSGEILDAPSAMALMLADRKLGESTR